MELNCHGVQPNSRVLLPTLAGFGVGCPWPLQDTHEVVLRRTIPAADSGQVRGRLQSGELSGVVGLAKHPSGLAAAADARVLEAQDKLPISSPAFLKKNSASNNPSVATDLVDIRGA